MSMDRRFLDFLYQRIGLDAASVGPAMIERVVRQRQAALGLAALEAYWALLSSDDAEQQALIEAVIVPETWFMRYPESFAAFGRLARARWHEQGGARPLRVLSLPCSTGEEPYSLAMALFDAGLSASAFVIHAVDVSPQSLAKARRGLYGRNSFRGDYKAFQARYFTATPEGHHVQPRLLEQIHLQPGNILDPLLLAGEQPYDFVFCRNLLIYFDVPTQQQAVNALKAFTREDGVLFIGPAEGSLLASNGMRPLGLAQAFAFVRQPEPAQAPRLTMPLPLPVPRPAPRAAPVTVTMAPVPRPVPPAAPVVEAAGSAALLAQIAALADAGKSAEARAACERYLKDHPPQAQVFYWLGLLSDAGGNALEAQNFYRKALYLEPQHPEALAHLAILLAARGDAEGARRLQARATRALKEPKA
ncbi:CheR family methyltransferase [Pseudomonas japonica]|uniref:CheR family methyltransferase n=1 Tax=Pseudomonas japonica TaxID=256466 RepID=UPI0015E2FACD|nr:protein-glutamate O-methyltransferase CheR [Pseudomonas japonica]MBA1288990.1 protein-glutamate O-methyltransferase CheR [Pseudomonas japonica]